ncbi:hypothetical protein H0H81_000411 [Sphagnurus paluster]|uniref:Uncharacterized protein n=1 Tax=Sphagnurus paluster TaxID=117069 RepID=A0A9P7GI88_9AGAR|nr:hypothetical protein H0H81_000411 [Sphagnurus paluster]
MIDRQFHTLLDLEPPSSPNFPTVPTPWLARKPNARSPAESTRPAPSRPVSPVFQAASRCDTPDQGYFDPQHVQEHLDDDSSSELEYLQEEITPDSPKAIILKASEILQSNEEICTLLLPTYAELILDLVTKHHPFISKKILANNKAHKELTAQAVSAALASATPPPPPPPAMEVDSPTAPTGPKPPGATPRPRGKLPPPAAPVPSGRPAPSRTFPAKRALKTQSLPSLPTQMAPKPSYAAALGSKAPRPRKAHLPTKLVAPDTAKWVIAIQNKAPLRDVANRPSPHHIVQAINRELKSTAGAKFKDSQVADLGDSHILAASWTVGCNILITATKTSDNRGLNTKLYSAIVLQALFKISAFAKTAIMVIPYRPAARLQIKGLPTWDPITNKPVELTSVYQTLDGLGIFEGVELIKNGPPPSDALSWAQDPKTFNAESRPCAVTVRFYNNDGRETGALLKKAFYLLGCRRRFDKWHSRPPPPKKGLPQAASLQAGRT